MDIVKIKKVAKHLMAERKAHLEREKGGVFYHGERVANLVVALRKSILPNDASHDDLLRVAAWFHDCAKGIEPHADYGAAVAREALQDYISENKLNKICDLIKMHATRTPEDLILDDYTKLLQDADLIDHFGIYEIWMNIQFWAHTDGNFHDMIDWYKENFAEHITNNRKV